MTGAPVSAPPCLLDRLSVGQSLLAALGVNMAAWALAILTIRLLLG